MRTTCFFMLPEKAAEVEHGRIIGSLAPVTAQTAVLSNHQVLAYGCRETNPPLGLDLLPEKLPPVYSASTHHEEDGSPVLDTLDVPYDVARAYGLRSRPCIQLCNPSGLARPDIHTP